MMSDAESEAMANAAQAKAEVEGRHRRHGWRSEKEIREGWIGELAVSDEVPAIDQIDRVILLTGYKDRMVVVRPEGADLLELPTLTIDAAARDGARKGTPDKQLDRWLKPVCKGQWGIQIKDWFQYGRFEMHPTPENTEVAPDARRFDLILCATATRLNDLPEGSAWARRTVTRRDVVRLIADRYMEYDIMLNAAHEEYVIRRAQAAQGA